MGEGEQPNELTLPRLFVLLSGIASAALVVSIYHCISVGWCNRRRGGSPLQHNEREETQSGGLEHSMVQLIPAYRYDKEVGLIGDDGTCAVCLSEFVEGEELRTLPECMHSFHVPCIDMWLYSHASCPLCRADTTPSPQITHSLMTSGSSFVSPPPDVIRQP